MTNEITVQTPASMHVKMLSALRNSIAPGLTDAEFQLFSEMCRATGLNPALKEIWAIKAGGRLQLMTGINGFLKIANAHPQFDGIETSFEKDERGILIAATAKVHRKDRKYPAVATAYLSEYAKPTPIWKQMPSIMLAKCAKALAIREAFIQELGGLYAQEEMPSEYAVQEVQHVKFELPVKLQLQPAWYDISGIAPEKVEAATKYLESNSAEHLGHAVWKAPQALEKLQAYEIEEPKMVENEEN